MTAGEWRKRRGETVEGREPEESEDAEYSGARRTGQSGQPPFSDEDEMEMLEFIQAHPVLFAKEHVHYYGEEGQTVGGDREACGKIRGVWEDQAKM